MQLLGAIVSPFLIALLWKVCYTKNAAEKRQGADPNAGGCSLPVPECRAGQIFLLKYREVSRSPGRLRAERGDLTMTFEEVAILLTLLGGAIYVTFQITWTVSHGDDKRKKK